VGRGGVGALPAGRVPGSGDVTLVGGGTDNVRPAFPSRPCSDARLARVGLGARVAVVAGGTIGRRGVGALPRRRGARARHVTLIRWGGGHVGGGGGPPGRADAGGGEPVDGVAGATVGGGGVGVVRGGVGALPGRRVTGTGDVTLVGGGTDNVGAEVDGAASADAVAADVVDGRRVAVVAGGTVGRRGIGALPGRRVARARHVTLI